MLATSGYRQSQSLIGVGLSLTAASVSVMLRFTTRRTLRQRPFVDDGFMLAAAVKCSIGFEGRHS